MTEPLIRITDSAQEYLRDLLSRQDQGDIGVRIFVERPGTPHAECCMAYCPEGEQEEGDEREGKTEVVQVGDAPRGIGEDRNQKDERHRPLDRELRAHEQIVDL